MPCSRCSLCGINFPLGHSRCRVCDGPLDPIKSEDADSDWEDRASVACWKKTAEQREQQLADDVVAWRLSRFLELGVDVQEAEELARRHDVDHHALVELLHRGCPLGTAVRILA